MDLKDLIFGTFSFFFAILFTFVAAAIDGFAAPIVLIYMQQQAADKGVQDDCSDGRDDEAFKQAIVYLLYFSVARGVSKCFAALLALNFLIRVRVELTQAVHNIYMDVCTASHSASSFDAEVCAW